jgi:hypothetical protein
MEAPVLTRAALLTALEALPRTAQLTLAVGELHAALTAPSPVAGDDRAPAQAVRAWLPDARLRPSTDAPRSTVEGLLARLRASIAGVLEVGPELEERDVVDLVRELACFDLTLDRVLGRVQTRVDQRMALPRPSRPREGRRVRPAAPSAAIAGQEGQEAGKGTVPVEGGGQVRSARSAAS